MRPLPALSRPIVLGLAGLTLGISPSRPASAAQGGSPTTPAVPQNAAKLDQAAREYERLARDHPESAEVWSNLGAVRAMSGDCPKALPALQRAQSLNSRLYNPWFFAGYCYFSLHQDARAVESLQRATQLNSKDPNAWFVKAEAEGNLDRLAPSFESVVRSLELDPKRAEGYYLAGKTGLDLTQQLYSRVIAASTPNPYELLLDGERNASQGVWNLALQEYQKALVLAPGSSFLQFALGSAFLESGEYRPAEEAFRKSLAAATGSRWAKLRLALALARQGKTPEATVLYRTVTPENLELPDEFLDDLRCASLLRQDTREQAVLALARQRFPDSPQFTDWKKGSGSAGDALQLRALTGPGLAFRFLLAAEPASGNFVKRAFPTPDKYRRFRRAYLRGDTVQAAAVVASNLGALPSDPDHALAHGEMLHCLSLGFYEHLGKAFPDSTPAMTLAAENYAAAGEQQKALEIYQEMLRKDGPSPELLYNIARIHWTEHRWDEALKILKSLAALDPNDATVFVNMGRIFSYTHDETRADQSFRRALELDPKMFEAHLGLGQTLHREGDLQGAVRELEVAESLNPQFARTHYELSRLYRQLGKSELAAREMGDFTRLQAQAAAENTRRGRQLVPLD